MPASLTLPLEIRARYMGHWVAEAAGQAEIAMMRKDKRARPHCAKALGITVLALAWA